MHTSHTHIRTRTHTNNQCRFSGPEFIQYNYHGYRVFSRLLVGYITGFNVKNKFPTGPLGQFIRALLAPCIFSLAWQPKNENISIILNILLYIICTTVKLPLGLVVFLFYWNVMYIRAVQYAAKYFVTIERLFRNYLFIEFTTNTTNMLYRDRYCYRDIE